MRFVDEMPFNEIALQNRQSLEATKSLFRRSLPLWQRKWKGTMNNFSKSQDQQLDNLLSEFTDQVLSSDENEANMLEVTNQDELAELAKNRSPHESSSPESAYK